MYVCIQICTYTHVGRPDILFVHKIKRSQESDIVVGKANAALSYTDGWRPNAWMQCDGEEMTRSGLRKTWLHHL